MKVKIDKKLKERIIKLLVPKQTIREFIELGVYYYIIDVEETSKDK